jgi:hypothetical protein
MKIVRVLTVAAIVTVSVPRMALADPINITAGFLKMNPTSGPLVLFGDRGFTFSSGVSVAGGIFRPWDCNGDPIHCRPGDTLNLGAFFSGNDAGGTATLDGITYTAVGSLSSFSSMTVEFSGMAVLPALQNATVAITAPFLFSGSFFHPVDNNPLGFPAVTDSLVGGGVATVSIAPAAFAGSWYVRNAQYDFTDPNAAPTPEPATLFLFGSAAVGLGLFVRRRGRRPRAL